MRKMSERVTNVQKGKQMGRDDPVTRVGNEIFGGKMCKKDGGERGKDGKQQSLRTIG